MNYSSFNLRFILFIFGIVILIESPFVNAQCVNPPIVGESRSWSKYASVSVNINPTGYDSEQQSAIHDAFISWQNAPQNLWNVTFSFTYSSTPISGTNTYQVTQSSPNCPRNMTCAATTGGTSSGLRRTSAYTNISSRVIVLTALTEIMVHEIGHTFGLDDCNCDYGTTTMAQALSYSIINGVNSPTTCDITTVNTLYPTPTPTPTPYPTLGEFCGDGFPRSSESQESSESERPDPNCCNSSVEADVCVINGGIWSPETCTCMSPIVIDVAGNGFDLTDAQNGVSFDIFNDGISKQVSWTSANSDDAWLALDRNGNGTIDNGGELFGSSTLQHYLGEGESKNGFRALAIFDEAGRGGNGDGQIDSRDSVFSQLKLWQDVNHNGISEQSELHGLTEFDIRIIDLNYHESKRHDENGNWFRYRAKVKNAQGAQVGRWAWDVFLQLQP